MENLFCFYGNQPEKRKKIHENFISPKKCVLLYTTCTILHISAQDTSVFAFFLHRHPFVTGLFLDKPKTLWQYIVEVDSF